MFETFAALVSNVGVLCGIFYTLYRIRQDQVERNREDAIKEELRIRKEEEEKRKEESTEHKQEERFNKLENLINNSNSQIMGRIDLIDERVAMNTRSNEETRTMLRDHMNRSGH